jgi:hypothetical protein
MSTTMIESSQVRTSRSSVRERRKWMKSRAVSSKTGRSSSVPSPRGSETVAGGSWLSFREAWPLAVSRSPETSDGTVAVAVASLPAMSIPSPTTVGASSASPVTTPSPRPAPEDDTGSSALRSAWTTASAASSTTLSVSPTARGSKLALTV